MSSHPIESVHTDRARRSPAIVAVALLSLGAVGCGASTETDAGVAGLAPVDVVAAELTDVSDAALTTSDVAALLWMREEEQLAHDVYVVLGDLWGVRIFDNIASSEQTHVDAVVQVLDRYGIDDPAAANEPGTFTDQRIQSLYDELVATGSSSLVAALEVGALIEELDISDLRARSSATDVDVLASLYAQLEQGSRNHLRAFSSQLEARGVAYEPTRLTVDEYESIVSTPTERGRDT